MEEKQLKKLMMESREQLSGSKEGKAYFLSEGLAGVPYFNVPYNLDVTAISIITKGSLKGACNLLPIDIEGPALTCFFPRQIIEYHSISADADVKLITMTTDFAETLTNNKSYNAYLQFMETPAVKLTDEELQTMLHFFHLLKDVDSMEDDDTKQEIIKHLFHAFFHIATHLSGYQHQILRKKSHKEEIFEAFYKEVIAHHREARDVAYYADLLCITPRYLGRIVKEVTGKNAADWVNEYVVLEAKSLLRTHRELTLEDISDQLGFPNQSFFGKLFKRYTGVTPKGYREG